MASKKRRAEGAVKKDTHASLIRELYEKYDFSPTMNKRLAKLQDPLLNIPDFITNRERRLPASEKDNHIALGYICGYRLGIEHFPNSPQLHRRTCLRVGCQHIWSEEQGRRHWPGNVSVDSRERRPHYDEMLDFVKEICQYRGWAW